jgi:hypothetical protein
VSKHAPNCPAFVFMGMLDCTCGAEPASPADRPTPGAPDIPALIAEIEAGLSVLECHRSGWRTLRGSRT